MLFSAIIALVAGSSKAKNSAKKPPEEKKLVLDQPLGDSNDRIINDIIGAAP